MARCKRRLLVCILVAVCVLVCEIMTRPRSKETNTSPWKNNPNTDIDVYYITMASTKTSAPTTSTTTTATKTTTEHELCKWNHSLSRPDKRASDLAKNPSLLYNINLDKEMKAAILGSPVQFLDNYRNPCWRSTLPDISTYSSNPILLAKNTSLPAENVLSELRANKATSRLRCLPLVYFIGSAKAGTTDLFRIMSQHPDVEAPETKEVFFWNSRRFTGGANFTQYVEVYDTAAKRIEDGDEANTRCHHKITVDGTPNTLDTFGWSYMGNKKSGNLPPFFVSDTIRHMVPGARIVVSLRKPTDRIYSYFRMRCPYCDVNDFHNLVSVGVNELMNCTRQHPMTECLYQNRWARSSETMVMHLKSSFYVVFLENWLRSFPRDQVLVLRAEDYFKNRTQVILEISQFLKIGVPNNEILGRMSTHKVYNSGKPTIPSLPMTSQTRKLLGDLYRPYNEKLAKLLNDDKFLWKDT